MGLLIFFEFSGKCIEGFPFGKKNNAYVSVKKFKICLKKYNFDENPATPYGGWYQKETT